MPGTILNTPFRGTASNPAAPVSGLHASARQGKVRICGDGNAPSGTCDIGGSVGSCTMNAHAVAWLDKSVFWDRLRWGNCNHRQSPHSYTQSIAGTEGAFRLTDSRPGATPDSESGTLEVFHAGAWGTLCDGDFGILDVRAPQLVSTIIRSTCKACCDCASAYAVANLTRLVTSECLSLVFETGPTGVQCSYTLYVTSRCQLSSVATCLMCMCTRASHMRSHRPGTSHSARQV